MNLMEKYFSTLKQQKETTESIKSANLDGEFNSLKAQLSKELSRIENEDRGFSSSSGTTRARQNLVKENFLNELKNLKKDNF